MTEFSRYTFSVLQETEFILQRGTADDLDPILLLLPGAEAPLLASVKRLEHEYALRSELDPAWAARPFAMTCYRDRPALVLEDPGGVPLGELCGRPLELAQFIAIATALATAVRKMHDFTIIHKDIKPGNVLVDAVRGRAWLFGFGVASLLQREQRGGSPVEEIAGTLAYMAPEQTGRMNRSVDSRSDLYALGATLYHMLTGVPPFAATDPVELIHCHIAQQPTWPHERIRTIPRQISSIVMKLLAKTMEERYQTAAGLEIDLYRCRAECDSAGQIDDFPLGTRDFSDRLLIPEKLYGRDQEVATLLEAFNRMVASGTPEVVLISGYSGIGKSSVVNQLRTALIPPRALFASGKFDEYKDGVPYSTLVQAFESLVRIVLGLSEVELAQWRDLIKSALGPNGGLMVSLIPELELVIGPQPAIPDLPPEDALNRFQMTFRRLVGVFARRDHPLVLFLDDLQWLDAASLDVVQHLITSGEVRHYMVIGAYRDNQVDASHPLMRALDAIRNTGAPIHHIHLQSLRSEDVGRLMADTLRCDEDRVLPLTELVHKSTGGNPFFTIQLVAELAEEKLIAFDNNTGAWTWDLSAHWEPERW